mgnify:CR=1 FL=1
MSFLRRFRKSWEGELDRDIPELSENIRSMPIPERENTAAPVSHKRGIFSFFSARVGVAACALAILVISVAILPIMNALSPTEPPYTSAVTLEVNPRVTFMLDGEGRVSAVRAANADADLIVSREDFLSSVIGSDIASAAWQFVNLTARLGYLDVDGGGAVKVSGFGGGEIEQLISEVKASLGERLRGDGIFAVILDEILSEEKFAEINGITDGATGGLLDELKKAEALFGERGIGSLTSDELSARYESTIDRESIRERLLEELRDRGILEIIEALIPDADDGGFLSELGDVLEIMETFGIDTSNFAELLELPDTAEEYASKYFGSLNDKYDERINANLPSYGIEREEIGEEEYESLVNSIISEYGSLEDYWNSLKAQ